MRAAGRAAGSWLELLGFATTADPATTGSKTRFTVALSVVICLTFSYVFLNNATNRLGYKVAALEDLAELLAKEKLMLESSPTVASRGNVSSKARRDGMIPKKAWQVIHLDDEN